MIKIASLARASCACLAFATATFAGDDLLPATAVGNPTSLTSWGRDVHVDGDVMAVIGFELVSIFNRTEIGWSFAQHLDGATDVGSGAILGRKVDVHGDMMVVGGHYAPGAGPDSGAAYIFRNDGTSWQHEATVFPDDFTSGSTGFGFSVAIVDDDTVLVGSLVGFVFEYTREGGSWSLGETLGTAQGDFFFGDVVEATSDRFVCGALDFSYVFRRDGGAWVEEQVLSHPPALVTFGIDASFDGERVVFGYTEGVAIFARSGTTWSLEKQFDLDNDAAVAIEGNTLLVGEATGDGLISSSGVTTVYRLSSTWTIDCTLVHDNPLAGHQFGAVVALQGDEAFTSATAVGLPFTGKGTIYVHDISAGDGTWVDLGQGLAGQAGVPHLTGAGTLEGGEDVTLSLANAAALKPATLVVGISELNVPFKGGTLVPSPILLIPDTTPVVINATWPVGVPADTSFFFQIWIADAFGPQGLAASNGLQGVTP